MAYGKVHDTFWSDPKVRGMSRDARDAFLYLLTSPHRNRLGCFVLDPFYAAGDLQWGTSEVEEALKELEEEGRIRWDRDHRVVLIRKHWNHNTLENPNVVRGALTDLQAVPDTHLFVELLREVERHQKDVEKSPGRFDRLIAAIRGRLRKLNVDNPPEPTPPGDDNGSGKGSGNGMPNRSELLSQYQDLNLDHVQHPPPNPLHDELGEPSEDHGDPPAAEPAGVREDGEDEEGDEPRDQEPQPDDDPDDSDDPGHTVSRWLPLARKNIVAIHGGTEEPVEIEGHQVGIGIEIERFRRLAGKLSEGPEVLARAIRHLPAVTTLDPPISLARWEAEKDGFAVLSQCLAKAREEVPTEGEAPEVKLRPPPTDGDPDEFEQKRAGALRQLEALRKADDGVRDGSEAGAA